MPLLTHADLLKTHLLAQDALDGVAVHVTRQGDVREMAVHTLDQKTQGAFLAITLGSWTPSNEDGDPYWADLLYQLEFACLPHLLEEMDLPTFDVLLASLVNAIHGWQPEEVDPAYCTAWRVGPGRLVPPDVEDLLLIYAFPATIAADFTRPPVAAS